jgi:hypothetical protein
MRCEYLYVQNTGVNRIFPYCSTVKGNNVFLCDVLIRSRDQVDIMPRVFMRPTELEMGRYTIPVYHTGTLFCFCVSYPTLVNLYTYLYPCIFFLRFSDGVALFSFEEVHRHF